MFILRGKPAFAKFLGYDPQLGVVFETVGPSKISRFQPQRERSYAR